MEKEQDKIPSANSGIEPQARKRRPRRRPPQQRQKTQQHQTEDDKTAKQSTSNGVGAGATTPASIQKQQTDPPSTSNNNTSKKTKKSRAKKKKGQSQQQQHQKEESTGNVQDNKANSNNELKQGKKKKKNKKRKKRQWWCKFIPPHTVDPITLEPLRSLPYKPFALVATLPYEPVKEWPVMEKKHATSKPDKEEMTKKASSSTGDANRKRLEEQWGNKLKIDDNLTLEKVDVDSGTNTENKRHYHLYDGRALAYYLVSQGQYIDPLNRRDLTRDELVNLDRYLVKNGFKDLKVVEAYDAKGITISTAGTQAQTNEGRAEILQQTAQTLLNTLFTNRNPPSQNHQSIHNHRHQSRPEASTEAEHQGSGNFLRQQYAAAYQAEASATEGQNNSTGTWDRVNEDDDVGIYGEADGGMILIDDDANPGLRGTGLRNAAATASTAGASVSGPENTYSNAFWSASHIMDRYNHASEAHAQNFPSLPTAPQPPTKPHPNRNSISQPSNSLAKISKVVQKTDRAEIEKQQKAREVAQRRAQLANLSFVPEGEFQPSAYLSIEEQAAFLRGNHQQFSPSLDDHLTSDAKLERNRAFADALGVKPSTVRGANDRGGWARPTAVKIELDEFGNELNTAQYPDSLILSARENMDLLYKLERKWKKFLSDDMASSCHLKRMDKPTRAFVHEYAAFWILKTESFDPEPMRYVHCTKLRDTKTPHPLLSEAVINWRGPAMYQTLPAKPRTYAEPARKPMAEPRPQQSAGQGTNSRDFPPPPDREPLKLLPRSDIGKMYQQNEFDTAVGRFPGAATSDVPYSDPPQNGTRFGGLLDDRERPKLSLTPRSIPHELPPYQRMKGYTATVDDERLKRRVEMAEKVKKQQEKEEQKKKLIEQAFESDDEADSSEWSEESELYSGSDEED